jgi:tRNA1(Val) A37 N6-methylase TrmN6
MALMFSRLAHNFIKNGYFPTDDETLTRILAVLQPAGQHMRIVDPCCGEGTALAHVKHHLQQGGEGVQALGVEFDAERAWHAKKLLDVAIHADIADVSLSRRSCGLLYLNPPYGHAVADKAQLGDATKSERLELIHLRRNFDCLQVGGVLVLIVPYYVLDETMSALLARNFERLQVFMAPEERFKQCVVLGVRRRSGHPSAAAVAHLVSTGRGERLDQVLPSTWSDEPYEVPEQAGDDGFAFHAIRIDAKQLGDELTRLNHQTLWPQFGQTFVQVRKEHRPPLRPLSRWHLALALAAGQITGVVTASNGRRLLIKGDTFKNKARTVERNVDDDGNVSETVILTDRFVPIIRGIDMSPGPKLGQIVTIR